MESWHTDSTDKFCRALLSLKTVEECYDFLEDAFTIKEVLEISQRLNIAELLCQKNSYLAVAKKTGASTTTISRISKCLEYGNGGYKTVISRINGEEKDV